MTTDCSTCRFHSADMRPKPIAELGFDALFEVEDEDKPYYKCKAKQGPRAGNEIGFTPVSCESHQPATIRINSALEEKLRAWEARNGATP